MSRNARDLCSQAAALVMAAVLAGVMAMTVAASAQEVRAQSAQKPEPPAQAAGKPEGSFLGPIGDWFERQFSNMKSDIKSAKENFDRDTDRATKKTIETAKDAADAVTSIPDQRTVRGRESCLIAPNGAPDCDAAASKLCRANGYGSGKSLDSTTAENCPTRVLLSGRTPGAGECKTETFISRALCSP
jgi:hypothetical protein